MGSGCARWFRDPEGPTLWYQPGSEQSLSWCSQETGFGYKRNKSYLRMACGQNVDLSVVNRNGNFNGELAGKIKFYKKAPRDLDYSTLDECPTITLAKNDKLFAKAFLPAPLDRIPIGENNLLRTKERRGGGAVLLAPHPQAVAVCVTVNGTTQCQEHFCQDSLAGRRQELQDEKKKLDKTKQKGKQIPKEEENPDQNNEEMDEPDLLTNPVKGSFFTFVVSRHQNPHCFLHFPLLGSLDDTSIVTGHYAENILRCFCALIQGLAPGSHKLQLRIRLCFDNADYNCLLLGRGSNPLGKWGRTLLPHHLLKEAHENPAMLVCSKTLAKGSLILHVSADYSPEDVLAALDRRPPPEVYKGYDSERLRQVARV